jgi:hypothetical protein
MALKKPCWTRVSTGGLRHRQLLPLDLSPRRPSADAGCTRADAVLSMAEWPGRTPSRMLNEFLKQPVEYIVTQA